MGDGKICHLMLIFFINTWVRDMFTGGAKYIAIFSGVYRWLWIPGLVLFRLLEDDGRGKVNIYCTRSLEFTPLSTLHFWEVLCLGANT